MGSRVHVVSSVIVRAGLALFENVTEVWKYTFQFFSVPIYALIVCGIGFFLGHGRSGGN